MMMMMMMMMMMASTYQYHLLSLLISPEEVDSTSRCIYMRAAQHENRAMAFFNIYLGWHRQLWPVKVLPVQYRRYR